MTQWRKAKQWRGKAFAENATNGGRKQCLLNTGDDGERKTIIGVFAKHNKCTRYCRWDKNDWAPHYPKDKISSSTPCNALREIAMRERSNSIHALIEGGVQKYHLVK